MKSKPITAGELIAERERDPTWLAERARRHSAHQQRIEDARRDEAPLLADLRAAGLAIDSPWEPLHRGDPCPTAIPILLDHLQRPYPGQTREWIARTLGALRASPTWDALVRFYRAEHDARARDGIAAALADLADDTRLDELIELVRDRRHGPSRLLLLTPLRRSKLSKAGATIDARRRSRSPARDRAHPEGTRAQRAPEAQEIAAYLGGHSCVAATRRDAEAVDSTKRRHDHAAGPPH